MQVDRKVSGLLAAVLFIFTSRCALSRDDSNNWAVLVSTSKYWYNYRHATNILSIYNSIKKLGFPDEKIILMLADDPTSNPRNVMKGSISNGEPNGADIALNAQVDYRGEDVTRENFLRLLTGRTSLGQPVFKYLNSNNNSNVFIYICGHGGDEFLKFQDINELNSHDIADAFLEMHLRERYQRILFMVDTCQAGTLFNRIEAPSIISIGSSDSGENSYAHQVDPVIGLPTMDRFSFSTMQLFKRVLDDETLTIRKMFSLYNAQFLRSTPVIKMTDRSDSFVDESLQHFFGVKSGSQSKE